MIDGSTFAPATNCDIYRFDAKLETFVRKTFVAEDLGRRDDESEEGENMV